MFIVFNFRDFHQKKPIQMMRFLQQILRGAPSADWPEVSRILMNNKQPRERFLPCVCSYPS